MDGLIVVALIAMSVMTLLNMRARPPQVIVLTAPPEPQHSGCMPRLALAALLLAVFTLLTALVR
ncbi:MAG TPA: hypothetical protein VFS21_25995 [Roseiflexaceae bacterium]|nr:hypothetical protein [Roseiflexaceae bacterium]